MKKWILSLSIFSMMLCGVATAQQPVKGLPKKPENMSPLQYAEMLDYLQRMQSYNDPRMIVRRNAEFRAQQRRARIATRKWFGYSNARPIAETTPYMGTYSPYWGGNSWNPYLWTGGGYHPSATINVYTDSLRR